MNIKYFFIFLLGLFFACNSRESAGLIPEKESTTSTSTSTTNTNTSGLELVILGTIQDAGSPHIACKKACCKDLFPHPDPDRKVVSLGVIDRASQQTFLFEASPDMPVQLKSLKRIAAFREQETPDGIFLTHAHIGHYTGLMYLGKEAMNASSIPVYAMPKMKTFLEENGPWSQLVTTQNIAIQTLSTDTTAVLSSSLQVLPFRVPHRDEYSETVGYTIIGQHKRALFIPDIDKWEKWDTDIIKAIAEVDYAFLDGTFYDAAEINNRDISQIPHPFIIESMDKFKALSAAEKAKIHFIHFNHTNPVINKESEQTKTVLQKGFQIARIHQVFSL